MNQSPIAINSDNFVLSFASYLLLEKAIKKLEEGRSGGERSFAVAEFLLKDVITIINGIKLHDRERIIIQPVNFGIVPRLINALKFAEQYNYFNDLLSTFKNEKGEWEDKILESLYSTMRRAVLYFKTKDNKISTMYIVIREHEVPNRLVLLSLQDYFKEALERAKVLKSDLEGDEEVFPIAEELEKTYSDILNFIKKHVLGWEGGNEQNEA